MKQFFLYLHQAPQNILGFLMIAVTKAQFDGFAYIASRFCHTWTGVSFGKYVLLTRPYNSTRLAHERGHQKQSLYLGWLYLIVIGIPSLIGNIIHRYIKYDYYSVWWEAWADKLGKVNRRKL